MQNLNRRKLLGSSAAGAAALSIRRCEASNVVQANLGGEATELELERLAENIMECEPHRVVDFLIAKSNSGMVPQDLQLACFIAGMRFHGHHSAYVAHPIHVVSEQLSAEYSQLPLFYYASVLRFRAKRTALRELVNGILPSASRAKEYFHAAMEKGERNDATLAMKALCNEYGHRQAYEELWKYAAQRNHNSGGHTAISVVNTYRTLHATGWRCADTALQFAVADEAWHMPGGSGLQAENWIRALQVGRLPQGWNASTSHAVTVRELLQLFRQGKASLACEEIHAKLASGEVSSGTIWDAVFLVTAELVMRYRWVGSKRLAGHSVTCVNALNFLFRNSNDAQIQLYALLESVEWAVSFLQRERDRPALRSKSILELDSAIADVEDDQLDQVFAKLPPRRFASMHRPDLSEVDAAMQLAFNWALHREDYSEFWQMAQKLMCMKSTPEVHDFKYPMALLENCQHVSERWRPYLLAASVHVLQGTDMEDSPIVYEASQKLNVLQ